MRIFYKAVGVHAEVAQEELRVPALKVKAHEDVGGGFEQGPDMLRPYPKTDHLDSTGPWPQRNGSNLIFN